MKKSPKWAPGVTASVITAIRRLRWPRGSRQSPVRRSSWCSWKKRRFSAIVAPGSLPSPLVSRRIPMPAVWKSMVEITRSDRMATPPRLRSYPRRATRPEEGRRGLGEHERRARRRTNLGGDIRGGGEHGRLVERQDAAIAEHPRPVDHHGRDRGGGAVLDQVRHRRRRAGQRGAARIEQHQVGALPRLDAADGAALTDRAGA